MVCDIAGGETVADDLAACVHVIGEAEVATEGAKIDRDEGGGCGRAGVSGDRGPDEDCTQDEHELARPQDTTGGSPAGCGGVRGDVPWRHRASSTRERGLTHRHPAALRLRGVVAVAVVSAPEPIVAIEHQPENLGRIEGRERILEELPPSPVGGHHDEQGVHDPRDEPTVGYGGNRRCVDDDVVVLPPRFFKQLVEPRRMERLVGTRGTPTGWEHRKTRAGKLPHHVRQRQTLVRDRVRETSTVGVLDAEDATDAGLAKVGLDEENAHSRRLGKGTGQVDRCRGLAVARGRAFLTLPPCGGAPGTAQPRTRLARRSSPSSRLASLASLTRGERACRKC